MSRVLDVINESNISLAIMSNKSTQPKPRMQIKKLLAIQIQSQKKHKTDPFQFINQKNSRGTFTFNELKKTTL